MKIYTKYLNKAKAKYLNKAKIYTKYLNKPRINKNSQCNVVDQ